MSGTVLICLIIKGLEFRCGQLVQDRVRQKKGDILITDSWKKVFLLFADPSKKVHIILVLNTLLETVLLCRCNEKLLEHYMSFKLQGERY
jgi:hypothetical protein